jgi:hypothetical protein
VLVLQLCNAALLFGSGCFPQLRLPCVPRAFMHARTQVDFDGPYPLEGAKQVASVITRYVAPALRKCPSATTEASVLHRIWGMASKPLAGSRRVSAHEVDAVLWLTVTPEGQLAAMYPVINSAVAHKA